MGWEHRHANLALLVAVVVGGLGAAELALRMMGIE
jgi:hypothetical protein